MWSDVIRPHRMRRKWTPSLRNGSPVPIRPRSCHRTAAVVAHGDVEDVERDPRQYVREAAVPGAAAALGMAHASESVIAREAVLAVGGEHPLHGVVVAATYIAEGAPQLGAHDGVIH